MKYIEIVLQKAAISHRELACDEISPEPQVAIGSLEALPVQNLALTIKRTGGSDGIRRRASCVDGRRFLLLKTFAARAAAYSEQTGNLVPRIVQLPFSFVSIV